MLSRRNEATGFCFLNFSKTVLQVCSLSLPLSPSPCVCVYLCVWASITLIVYVKLGQWILKVMWCASALCFTSPPSVYFHLIFLCSENFLTRYFCLFFTSTASPLWQSFQSPSNKKVEYVPTQCLGVMLYSCQVLAMNVLYFSLSTPLSWALGVLLAPGLAPWFGFLIGLKQLSRVVWLAVSLCGLHFIHCFHSRSH